MAGLYVHIPFCRQRCSYCDFYFVTGSRHIDSFVEALVAEIEAVPRQLRGESIETVYFGGGTPSRLPAAALRRILDTMLSGFSISDTAEWTIEVNPDDCDKEYLAELANMSFNRLSIGIQSLKASDLAFMHRAHTVRDAETVVDVAREAGFAQFSVDFIFGLPDQTIADWRSCLDFAIEGNVPHVSTYGLTVEPRTVLHHWIEHGQAPAPDPDLMADMYLETMSVLEAAGYDHYEISSFAKPGFASRHNSAYWNHINYLGFGPSAHSFWWAGSAERWANVRSLRRYLDWAADSRKISALVADREVLDLTTLANEYLMLRLRTSSGVNRKELESAYRHRFSETGERLVAELVSAGHLFDDGTTVCLSSAGKLLADTISLRLSSDGTIQSVLGVNPDESIGL